MIIKEKVERLKELSRKEATAITDSAEAWMHFLDTASRLYRYDFDDLLLIHMQRPDATACAEVSVWNNPMNRRIKKGAKGIKLIDRSGEWEKLRYVFDVSDTRPVQGKGMDPGLWVLQEADRETPRD